MKKYLIFTVREFLGLDNDYETLLENQNSIINSQEIILNNLNQIQENQVKESTSSYTDYITLKNLLWLLIILGFISGGFWLYNLDLFNDTTLNSIKNLGTLTKELQNINHQNILEGLKLLNENTANLSGEQLKKLNEVLHYIQIIKSIVDPNPQGKQSLESLLVEKNGGIEWGN